MNLNKKPLVEVILEIKWELETQAGLLVDPLYDILIGNLFDRIKTEFPIWKKLPISAVPANMIPHRPQHQFRACEDGWPLVQFGPGVITVNETEGYEWETFRSICNKVFDALSEGYSSHPLKVTDVMLRYIDADLLGGDTPTKFLQSFGVNISLPESIHLKDIVSTSSSDLSLNITYPISKPKGIGALTFSSGEKENQPALIWETIVRSTKSDFQDQPFKLDSWLGDAHYITHEWFFTLISEHLERYK